MGILTSLLLGTTIMLMALFFGLVFYVIYVNRYFKKRGIPFDIPPLSLTSIISTTPIQKSFTNMLAELYAKHNGHKVVGFLSLWKRKVLIVDRNVIRDVLVKDFDRFQDRGLYYNKDTDPLGAHIFALRGQEWKTRRAKLSPTFSSGKMKGIFSIMKECGTVLTNVAEQLSFENKPVNFQELFFRYGLAVISNTSFGFDSDALTNKNSKIFIMINKLFAPKIVRILRTLIRFNNDVAGLFKMSFTPPDVSEFFISLVMNAIKCRETSGVYRNDYLQLMIQLKHSGFLGANGAKMNLTNMEVAAEAYVSFVAGSETTSRTMSFCLYELAMNPAVQARLLEEVDSLREISYESIMNMEYLDMVVDETLRKYTPLGFLNRECTQDYQIAGTEILLEKGTHMMVSVRGLHYDPDLFPDPERFIPERFSKKNKGNIKPYSYMPFGIGPRFCIGQRFGKLSVKTGIVMVLRKFQVHRSSFTPEKIEFHPSTIITTACGGIWLHLTDRCASKTVDTDDNLGQL
ncbi:probable cytochrome P450 6a14 [Homalodisca vitripennis]|uniref:probable cytochrome P450 6a14 n=1 Tax=Homalodisca vitripennis TaxID=197043 RepID=UPI001EEB5C24|nr:probable cytochrome P450 6a14 [Homalodisca vitripennis]